MTNVGFARNRQIDAPVAISAFHCGKRGFVVKLLAGQSGKRASDGTGRCCCCREASRTLCPKLGVSQAACLTFVPSGSFRTRSFSWTCSPA